MKYKFYIRYHPSLLLFLCLFSFFFSSCSSDGPNDPDDITKVPEHDKSFGIYSLKLSNGEVKLLFSTDNPIQKIHANQESTKLVFSEIFGDDEFRDSEICMINTDGSGYHRITDNSWLDAYPSWSPDGTKILFLSWPDYPENTMDIFTMDSNGTNITELYDSGYHDGDCSRTGDKIVFTRQSQIWIMDANGTNERQITDYERAGEQGNANLPFGDYDPRLNPAGTVICFDRMVDDVSASGNYNFYIINTDGSGETAITGSGWQQFMAEWSNSGDKLIFLVAAKGGDGLYDLYTMNADGSGRKNITPAGWPATFLCSHAVFSSDDSMIYFVGQWWE